MNAANILVVDDEPQIRRVLRSTLTSQGYVLTDAKTGEEAIEIARKAKPDLILLDVNMPGMGGIETCREIRRFSSAPIIMLTVRNAERDKVLALDAGADDYVVKPFGIEELLARVRAGAEVVIESGTAPAAVLRIASPPRRSIFECIALLPEDSTATIDADFARDVESAIQSHREPLDPPAWD